MLGYGGGIRSTFSPFFIFSFAWRDWFIKVSSHHGANKQIASVLKLDELLTWFSSQKKSDLVQIFQQHASHRNKPESFEEWPSANLTTRQTTTNSFSLRSISLCRRWGSLEDYIAGDPGGAGQHVQGDHDDQQRHHGATGGSAEEQDDFLYCWGLNIHFCDPWKHLISVGHIELSGDSWKEDCITVDHMMRDCPSISS